MFIQIKSLKKILPTPIFLLVAIVAIPVAIVAVPFALVFSVVNIPFAKHRTKKLPDMLLNDWQPREKYIYIGLNSDSMLSDYVKKSILIHYKKHIIWDEWDTEHNDWKQSEPDNSDRVTTFWQDIGGDYDDDLRVVIASYSPNDHIISRDHNFHTFWVADSEEDIWYESEKISIREAQEKIQTIVDNAMAKWKYYML